MAQYGGISKYDEPVDEADMRDEDDMSDEEFQNDTFFEGNSFAGIRSAGDIERLEKQLAELENELAQQTRDGRLDDEYYALMRKIEERKMKLLQHKHDRARQDANKKLKTVQTLCSAINEIADVNDANPNKFYDLQKAIINSLTALHAWRAHGNTHAS